MITEIESDITKIDTTHYAGFILRNNLRTNTSLPASGPYNLCPDIIHSVSLLKDPASLLGSAGSYTHAYDVTPAIGKDNYYYLRGVNSAFKEQEKQLSLYYTPAQLILHPDTWKNNALTTEDGDASIAITALHNEITVAPEPFVWKDTPAVEESDFYAFVAQANDEDNSNPVPQIDNWLDLSALLSQNLGFAFHNTCQVEANALSWAYSFQLSLPESIPGDATFALSIACTGFDGNTISMSDANGKLGINAFKASADHDLEEKVTLPSGYATTLTLQYENTGADFPVSGAAITVSIDYQVPDHAVHSAGVRGVLKSVYRDLQQLEAGTPVHHYVALGAVTFIVV